MQESNIYDLTAVASASAGLPHARLLVDALTAIAGQRLRAHFGDSASTVTSTVRPGLTWGALVRQGITALERNPHFFVEWFRLILIDVTDYRRWRDDAKQESVAIAGQQPRRASPKDVREAVRVHIDSERSQGRQASQKRVWAWAKAVLPGATYRQVMAAMESVQGGRRNRGRPRKKKAASR